MASTYFVVFPPSVEHTLQAFSFVNLQLDGLGLPLGCIALRSYRAKLLATMLAPPALMVCYIGEALPTCAFLRGCVTDPVGEGDGETTQAAAGSSELSRRKRRGSALHGWNEGSAASRPVKEGAGRLTERKSSKEKQEAMAKEQSKRRREKGQSTTKASIGFTSRLRAGTNKGGVLPSMKKLPSPAAAAEDAESPPQGGPAAQAAEDGEIREHAQDGRELGGLEC